MNVTKLVPGTRAAAILNHVAHTLSSTKTAKIMSFAPYTVNSLDTKPQLQNLFIPVYQSSN